MILDSTGHPGFFFKRRLIKSMSAQKQPDKHNNKNGFGNSMYNGFERHFKYFKFQSRWKSQFINRNNRNKSNQEYFQRIQQQFDK